MTLDHLKRLSWRGLRAAPNLDPRPGQHSLEIVAMVATF